MSVQKPVLPANVAALMPTSMLVKDANGLLRLGGGLLNFGRKMFGKAPKPYGAWPGFTPQGAAAAGSTAANTATGVASSVGNTVKGTMKAMALPAAGAVGWYGGNAKGRFDGAFETAEQMTHQLTNMPFVDRLKFSIGMMAPKTLDLRRRMYESFPQADLSEPSSWGPGFLRARLLNAESKRKATPTA